jgi:hypothetical protein
MNLRWFPIALALLPLAAALAEASGRKPEPASSAQQPGPDSRPVEPTPPVPTDGEARLPVFLAELPNPNDFVLFANGGWDGNWYVGYNTCWISKLPPAPPGPYARAFIGAKLGRMKTEPVPGRPSWERRPIPGEVNIAVAQEPLWPQSRRFLLADSGEIPLEPDMEHAVEGVGESRWFWVEVPVRFISDKRDNYVALFSPTKEFSDSRHAPILAAGWGESRDNTWLNSSAKGEPPFNPEEALKTAVTYFEPALAIKLVPPNNRAVSVSLVDAPEHVDFAGEELILRTSVEGTDVRGAWIEFSTDTRAWNRAVTPILTAPYIFSVKRENLPAGRNLLRAVAVDIRGNRGESGTVSVLVPAAEPPKKKRSR